jgi:hypothetical protein
MMHTDSKRVDEIGDEEGFLARWSKRKQASLEIAPEIGSSNELTTTAEEDAASPGDEAMPAVESLTEDSDFTGFLSPKVSEGLRRLALRKLFHSAGFNVCDGLDDYDEDFTCFTKLEGIITSDMWHQLDDAGKKLSQPQGSAGAVSPVDLENARDQESEREDRSTVKRGTRAMETADDTHTLVAFQDDEPVEDEIEQ